MGVLTVPGGSCDVEGEQQGVWAGALGAPLAGRACAVLILPLLPPAAPPGSCLTTAIHSRAGSGTRLARSPAV